MRPFWGTRRSVMSSPERIFSREMSADWIPRGTESISWSTPSMRSRIRSSVSVGSRWMSDARALMARSSRESTYRTTGASPSSSIIADTLAGRSSAVFFAAASVRSVLSRLNRAISLLKSSPVTTSGRTVIPVADRMSSRARTSPGSVTATEMVLSDMEMGSM